LDLSEGIRFCTQCGSAAPAPVPGRSRHLLVQNLLLAVVAFLLLLLVIQSAAGGGAS
jgi:hypothetical protein